MAFDINRLALIGNAGQSDAPRTWSYKTEDAHAAVDSAGYFNAAAKILKVCDLIDVVVVTNMGESNEAVSTYGRHIVNSNDGSIVDVGDVTVGTVTDTD